MNHRALVLAASMERKSTTRAGQIEVAFRAVHGRAPTADEAKACAAHYAKLIEHHRQPHPYRRHSQQK